MRLMAREETNTGDENAAANLPPEKEILLHVFSIGKVFAIVNSCKRMA